MVMTNCPSITLSTVFLPSFLCFFSTQISLYFTAKYKESFSSVFPNLIINLFRYMLGIGGLPAVIMFFGMLFMPESPRYLVNLGNSKYHLIFHH